MCFPGDWVLHGKIASRQWGALTQQIFEIGSVLWPLHQGLTLFVSATWTIKWRLNLAGYGVIYLIASEVFAMRPCSLEMPSTLMNDVTFFVLFPFCRTFITFVDVPHNEWRKFVTLHLSRPIVPSITKLSRTLYEIDHSQITVPQPNMTLQHHSNPAESINITRTN